MARSLSLRAAGQRLFANWAARRQGSKHPPLILNHRLIYILPTRAGIGFGVLLSVIWIGSLNYSLNLGYVLAFWLAACGLLSMFWCFRNQSGLSISYGVIQPVFVGQMAQFPLLLNNPDNVSRSGIELSWGDALLGECEITARGQSELVLPLPATQRGWLHPGRATLANRQPLGLFRAWSYLHLDWACLVYPQPEANPPALPDNPDQLSLPANTAAAMTIFLRCAAMCPAIRQNMSPGVRQHAMACCAPNNMPAAAGIASGWIMTRYREIWIPNPGWHD